MLLVGAIAGCHCSVLWGAGLAIVACWSGGRFGGVDVVPLQGAIVVCYGGGRVMANFGGVDVVPLLGAIAAGKVPERRVTTNFGGVDVVPYKGAIVVCYGLGHLSLH